MNKWTYNKVSFKDGLSQHFCALHVCSFSWSQEGTYIMWEEQRKRLEMKVTIGWVVSPHPLKTFAKNFYFLDELSPIDAKEFSFISCCSHALFPTCLQWRVVCSCGDGSRGWWWQAGQCTVPALGATAFVFLTPWRYKKHPAFWLRLQSILSVPIKFFQWVFLYFLSLTILF